MPWAAFVGNGFVCACPAVVLSICDLKRTSLDIINLKNSPCNKKSCDYISGQVHQWKRESSMNLCSTWSTKQYSAILPLLFRPYPVCLQSVFLDGPSMLEFLKYFLSDPLQSWSWLSFATEHASLAMYSMSTLKGPATQVHDHMRKNPQQHHSPTSKNALKATMQTSEIFQVNIVEACRNLQADLRAVLYGHCLM